MTKPGFEQSDVPSIKRPVGITILAVLEFLKAPIIFILYSTELGWPWASASLIAIILGGYNLAVGWGLWEMKKWAYPIALLLAMLSIIIFILDFVGLDVAGFYFNSIFWVVDFFLEFIFEIKVTVEIWFIMVLSSQLISPLILLYYMTRARIKDVFRVTGFLL